MEKKSLPVLTIIGRPNVGKSALFNRIIGKRIAIVEDIPGVTRDRNYGQSEWQGEKFILIDTGGFVPHSKDEIEAEVRKQAEYAITESDVILFVVDSRTQFLDLDIDVANILRKQNKPVFLAVNKVDRTDDYTSTAEFYKLGLGEPYAISCLHGHGVADLLDDIVIKFPKNVILEEDHNIIKIAIVGRPNVGKSSILNQLLGEPRTIVTDQPGTTRDAIDTEFIYEGQKFLLIDTAGVRRKSRVTENLEYYSVNRAMHAIRRTDLAVLVIDAADGVTAQDAKLAGYIEKEGTSCIIGINKWDLVENQIDEFLNKIRQEKILGKEKSFEDKDDMQKKEKYYKSDEFNPRHLADDRGTHLSKAMQEYEKHINEELYFMTWAPIVYTCALTGQRILKILDMAKLVIEERKKRIQTSEMNKFLEDLVHRRQPPEKFAKPVKLYYITQTDVNPPHFTLFVNMPKSIPDDYIRYLINSFRRQFGFMGTPITINIRAKKRE